MANLTLHITIQIGSYHCCIHYPMYLCKSRHAPGLLTTPKALIISYSQRIPNELKRTQYSPLGFYLKSFRYKTGKTDIKVSQINITTENNSRKIINNSFLVIYHFIVQIYLLTLTKP